MRIEELRLESLLSVSQNFVNYDVCEMTPDDDIHGMDAQFLAQAVVEILADSRRENAGGPE